jgi:hypothetical protein
MTAWIGSCSNAFFQLGYQPGGLRTWWRRLHDGSDEELDNTHLMRMAGRFARRVKARGAADAVPVIFCKAGERKHRSEPRTRARVFRVSSDLLRDPDTLWHSGFELVAHPSWRSRL